MPKTEPSPSPLEVAPLGQNFRVVRGNLALKLHVTNEGACIPAPGLITSPEFTPDSPDVHLFPSPVTPRSYSPSPLLAPVPHAANTNEGKRVWKSVYFSSGGGEMDFSLGQTPPSK